ncbi:MAG: HIT domain-containing protein [Patescibacteria group bacterium]
MVSKKHSELRQDLVSGDWILLAPGRLHGSPDFSLHKEKRTATPKNSCIFETPLDHVSEEILLGYEDGRSVKGWGKYRLLILENKFPAVRHPEGRVTELKYGPFRVVPGVGHHDLLITRDHTKNFPRLSPAHAREVFKAFAERYRMVGMGKEIAYVSMFHNWGPRAGASVYHPHYQMMSIPVVPPDVGHSLAGSGRYFKKHRTCVHCEMIAWERKMKERVIFETERAIAFAPFVSRNPFEARIFPKRHLPYFEDSGEADRDAVSDILQKILERVTKNMRDPDYNFFIHTAPVHNKSEYRHYHWHVEVYPKFNIRAGFEFGTGIDMNMIDPALAAKILRR